MKKKVQIFFLRINKLVMQWGYSRYIHKKERIEKEVGVIVLSNMVTALFWLIVSIQACDCYWLFTLMTIIPAYCYLKLAKAGFVWEQSITFWSFFISGILYSISFFVQLSKTSFAIPFSSA